MFEYIYYCETLGTLLQTNLNAVCIKINPFRADFSEELEILCKSQLRFDVSILSLWKMYKVLKTEMWKLENTKFMIYCYYTLDVCESRHLRQICLYFFVQFFCLPIKHTGRWFEIYFYCFIWVINYITNWKKLTKVRFEQSDIKNNKKETEKK